MKCPATTDGEHAWIEVTSLGDDERHFLCTCGETKTEEFEPITAAKLASNQITTSKIQANVITSGFPDPPGDADPSIDGFAPP